MGHRRLHDTLPPRTDGDPLTDRGTRLRVGHVGQDAGFALLRVNLDADDAAIRTELLTKAADKLGTSLPADVSSVRMYLSAGSPLVDMGDLEKDDVIWMSFDGGSWREPGEHGAQTSPGPAGACHCARTPHACNCRTAWTGRLRETICPQTDVLLVELLCWARLVARQFAQRPFVLLAQSTLRLQWVRSRMLGSRMLGRRRASNRKRRLGATLARA